MHGLLGLGDCEGFAMAQFPAKFGVDWGHSRFVPGLALNHAGQPHPKTLGMDS